MTNPPASSYDALSQQLLRDGCDDNLSLSLTLPLRDGALGTSPLTHQQTIPSLLKTDVPYVVAAIPRIVHASIASIISHRRETTRAELRDVALYSLLSLLQLQLVFSLSMLWLVVPALVLLPLLGLQGALIWMIILHVNRGSRSFTIAADKCRPGDSNSSEQCLDWFVIGGLLQDESMRQGLARKLAQIFGHDMRVFLPFRLGFLFDIILMIFQRNLHVPTSRSVALYNSVRISLLNPRTSGVRIIAHHMGSLDVSWLLARLCADFPPGDQLSKLQVFTFGAASMEMTLPLGHVHKQDGDSTNSDYPLVTHFAFADDPYAQVGVLLGIRHRLEGRFVGSLYTISNTDPATARFHLFSRNCHYTFGDYLDTLLPNGDPRRGVLGQVCKIDRELSEMRELAAIARSVTNKQPGSPRERLSWTALGMVASSMSNGYSMTGPYSLEEIRKKARSLEGIRGYEENPLANAVEDESRPRFGGSASDTEIADNSKRRRTRTARNDSIVRR
ncbi:hypothetical protein M426DRAFT_15452 [Hypoxylon sp. CI-4A]|nr:hypothetical protein M426DRAFT_15452 [Hypoxylon sp. CI-4A]